MANRLRDESPTWLNRTVLGTGLTSFLSDASHEIATVALPGLVTAMGAGAGALGMIEGVADGISAVAKVLGGALADRLPRRKPFVAVNYALTACATAALALAQNVSGLLAMRTCAWMGRGLRSPGKKAILAAAVPKSAYGRAFGFERSMDTLGAFAGPATAAFLIAAIGVRQTIAWTIVPGLAAVLAWLLLVKEKNRAPVVAAARPSLFASYRLLSANFRRFLGAVAVFGCGDYARSLLVLLAVERLTPTLGLTTATATGAALYLLHNIVYAAMAYPAGMAADRWPRPLVLAAGYLLGAAAAIAAMFAATVPALALAFALAGATLGIEESLEDSLAADLAATEQHGAAFGALAAVNGLGDFVASVGLGLLWAATGARVAFGAAALLALAGALLAARLPRTAS